MASPDDVREAIAVAGDRILAVGPSEEILRLTGDATHVVDLEGHTVLPAFLDPHTHVFSGRAWPGQTLSTSEIQDYFFSVGITTVADLLVTPADLDFVRTIAAAGSVELRTQLYLAHTTGCGIVLGPWYEQAPAGTELGPRVTVVGVKLFTERSNCGEDPAQSVFSAWALATMSDAWSAWFAGAKPVLSLKDLTAAVRRADSAGYSVAIHAIGDASVEEAFMAIAAVLGGRANDLRHKIAHGYYLPDSVLEQASSDGPVFLVEPLLLCGLAAQNEGVGPRAAAMYKRYPELIASGAHVALDSDWPLITADPILKLYAVVTGQEIRAAHADEGCDPSALATCTVSVWDGLRMLTRDAAWALNLDRELGTLEPGKLADLVVLSANPLRVDPQEIRGIRVLQTFQEGVCVYTKPESR